MFGAIAEAFGTAAQIDGQRSKDTYLHFENRNAAKTQYKRQKKLMDHQMANELELGRTMPSARVQGLRDAGLNPVLAAGANFGGGSAAGGNAAKPDVQVTNPSISSNIGAALNSGRALQQQLPVQTESANLLKEQQVTERKRQDQIDAETETEKNKPENVKAQTRLSDSQTIGKDLQNRLDRIPTEFYEDNPDLYFFRDGEIGAGGVKAANAVVKRFQTWLANKAAAKNAANAAKNAADAAKKATYKPETKKPRKTFKWY